MDYRLRAQPLSHGNLSLLESSAGKPRTSPTLSSDIDRFGVPKTRLRWGLWAEKTRLSLEALRRLTLPPREIGVTLFGAEKQGETGETGSIGRVRAPPIRLDLPAILPGAACLTLRR